MRVIHGRTKKDRKETIIHRPNVDVPAPVTMTLDVDSSLPPHTIKVSAGWDVTLRGRQTLGEACMAFLGVICKTTKVTEVRSNLARAERPWEQTSPLVFESPNWRETRDEGQQIQDFNRAQQFRSFIDMFSQLRKSTTENDASIENLRFDTMCRIILPNDYDELTKLRIESAQSQVARALNMNIDRREFGNARVSDHIVERFLLLISRGEWGKF